MQLYKTSEGCRQQGRHALLPRFCFYASRDGTRHEYAAPAPRPPPSPAHRPPLLLVTVCWPVEPPGQMATRTEHYHFADVFPRNVIFSFFFFSIVSGVLLEHYKPVKGPFLRLCFIQDASAC